jgi:hypothetical protein
MRVYNVTTTVKEYSLDVEQVMRDIIVLSDDENLHEVVYMLYPSYIIVEIDYHPVRNVHITKSYIAQEALKMVTIQFK